MSPLLLIPTLLVADAWKSYASKADHFTATFPGDVKVQTTDQSDEKMKMITRIYSAGGNGLACIVSVTSIPSDFPSSQRKTLIEGVKTGFGGETGQKVVGEGPATYNGIKGTLVKFSKDDTRASVWIVDRKTNLFTMTVYGQAGSMAENEKKFFGSIKMTK